MAIEISGKLDMVQMLVQKKNLDAKQKEKCQ